MSITVRPWGAHLGKDCDLFSLKNKNGASLLLNNYGAAIVGLSVPDKNGDFADVLLGYDSLEDYENGTSFQGAVIGRCANRIGGASFTLNGKTYHIAKNDGNNTLHGGAVGFDKKVWEVVSYTVDSLDTPSVSFGLFSPDGDENFPGKLSVLVKYTLTDDNAVSVFYRAKSDADTFVNLTNHSYFNLRGFDGGKILDHKISIDADFYTPIDGEFIPTGEVASVDGTPFDLRVAKRIGEAIENGTLTAGYDHNFVLGRAGEMKHAATVTEETTGRVMDVFTTMPGMQFYCGNMMTGETGKGGSKMDVRCGFCLETQFYPDSPNNPSFPSCLLKKGETFTSETVYKFSVKK